MSQCFLCQWWIQDKSNKAMGECWKEEPEARTPTFDALKVRDCAKYLLGAMHCVKSRTQRRMFFANNGVVTLK